ncbi:AraC family transcriptional regulator [Flavobacterium sp. 20NA77.7]|uniref:AraC family transcriptional regulator n=1 Tax=Flavobacterium nakdongensis TaxID=3073563 RepID=A0ABY9R719_9FLAO|nr:AraC family transcriptional regulator [Flavobacterium sp. 20NA77.7]WMW77058.1 AraC family transcriptional regulator [Flavobacterium sp. 20NA77.7]
MKAILEDIKIKKGRASFFAYTYQVPYFEFKWHYHPEYELTYIVKGSGYRIVGNTYEYFKEGDLVLLGSNLPHTWTGKSNQQEHSEAIVIQFSSEMIHSLLAYEESEYMYKMLKDSAMGLNFKSTNEIVNKMEIVLSSNGFEKIINLIALLNDLSKVAYRLISPNSFHTIVSKKNENRINKVCLYIQHNFNSKITLKQVAELIHQTESNFCKFFKKATGITFSDYVNEIRINEACRLLELTEMTISEIVFETGFENQSYFNRVFATKKKQTPSHYRKSVKQK